jgi:PAS domain S-box-containing protein
MNNLAQSETRYRQIVANLPIGVYTTTPDGRLVDANPAFLRIAGYASLEAINQVGVPALYADPADRRRLIAMLQQGPVAGFETRFRRADGQIVNVSISVRLVQEAGAEPYLEGILEDITERKRAQGTSLESEQRFRTLAEATFEGIVLSEKGMFVDLNDQHARMLGYARNELIGTPLLETVAPESRELVAEAIRSGRTEPYEHFARRKDGTTFPVEVRAGITWMAGRQMRVTAVRDITERKRAEMQLERNLRETRVRFEVSQALARKETEEEVLDALIQCAGIYPQALVGISIFDKSGGELMSVARRSDPFESGLVSSVPIGTRFPVANFPLIGLLSPGQSLVWNNVDTDERLDPASREIAHQTGASSFAVFPLTAGKEFIGFIIVFGKPADFFDEEKQHLYHTLAEQGAVALQTARLRDQIQGSLTRRSFQVQTSTEVAQEIAAAPALEELFQRVVTLIKERFNYYHAQIFRHETGQDAVALVMGYGEAGTKMLAAGHKLAMGRGVVGKAAATGRSVLAADVAQDADWRPNPNLPQTRGELAVPIKLRGEVLGVLDVQSDRAGALTEDDQLLLEGLCGQIALAIENRRAEDALQDQVAFAQRLIDNIPNPIFYKDTRGVYRGCNAAFEAYMGQSKDWILGKSVYDMAPKDLADKYHAMDQELFDHPGVQVYESAVRYADGVRHDVIFNKATFTNADGSLGGLVGVMVDITERKQAEQVLRASQAQLSEALRIAKLAYWEYDVEKDLFLFNDQFYALFHTNAEREGGYQISSAQYAQHFVHPDDLPIVGAEIDKALKSTDRHYSRQLEHRILYADGGDGHISVSINIDRDDQGHILRYYGANQDITERKRAEAEIQRTQQFLDSVIDNLPIMAFIKDAQELRFVRWNKAAEELTGFAGADMLGKNDYDFFPKHEADFFTSKDRQVLDNKMIADIPEETIQTVHQGVRLLHTTKVPILDAQGNPRYLLGISEDITERKAAEERTQEVMQELERLYRSTTREGWQALRERAQLSPGYVYDRATVRPSEDVWSPQIASAAQQGGLAHPTEQDAAVAAPLQVRGEIIGALGVQGDPQRPLSSDELELLQEIVAQGALALESARLYENASSLAARERMINEITARIRGSTTMEGILNAAVREIGQATGASFAAIDLELPEAS